MSNLIVALRHFVNTSENFNFLSSSDKIENNKMDGAYSAKGNRRGLYRVLMEKPEGKRPLRRLRLTREDNIKIDLQEV
jgi:hypothetical protein